MDVRAISVAPESRSAPFRDDERVFSAQATDAQPAERDLGPVQWVRPAERVSDVQNSREHIARALNEALQSMKFSLQFVVNADRLSIRVLDGDGEVVREIPPEEVQNMQQRLLEMVGVLFDKKEE
jgi:flagellar protein FlaG